MTAHTAANTLVIGGAGFIGSHLVPQLVNSGRSVTVLGRRASPAYELPVNATYISGDFANEYLINRLLDTHQEVIHMAYATVPNTSFENPLADLLENLPATVQLFSLAADKGVKLVLVSSGGTVYGEALQLPISELHRTKPISPYGVTKLTLENYAYLYAATHQLKFVCVRPSNAYGVGQRPFSGQGFISTAIASTLSGLPIKIFGNRGAVRDYLYVTDLASGLISALERGHLSEIYNLSSGRGLSNMDVIEAFTPIFEKINIKIQIDFQSARAFDVSVNILDSAKLHKHTGWKPSVSIEEGLLHTYEWLESLTI